ncbi:MAG: histone deacetylase [Gloeomargaritaceae cyanobacterium C42_A2020_066]|nr:histone deacetylase [Gloeomargaritaceae cyanobacterium C42_A2020_066]
MLTVLYSDRFLAHQTGRFHAERPARLQAVVEALRQVPWADQIHWQEPAGRHPVREWLTWIHDPAYLDWVEQVCAKGGGYLDGDTPVGGDSFEVALLAASAWLEGLDWVMAGRGPAFVLTRPPGHHALANEAMGFCLFGNAALTAHYALRHWEVERVAILDWDVHHGNGTQALVESHPQIAYCSLHQAPFYPGTGWHTERGPYGNVLNLPLAAGSNGEIYQRAFQDQMIPFLQAWRPAVLIISAGYDGHQDDPLASMALQPEDFGQFTQACRSVTDHLLFGLEGGYDLKGLAESVVATLAACLSFPSVGGS